MSDSELCVISIVLHTAIMKNYTTLSNGELRVINIVLYTSMKNYTTLF